MKEINFKTPKKLRSEKRQKMGQEENKEDSSQFRKQKISINQLKRQKRVRRKIMTITLNLQTLT
jgi:hypothetical protein